MSISYPTAIYADYPPFNGWSVIAQGHNLTDEQIQEAVAEAADGGCIATAKQEEFFYYVPRVKWCSNHGAGSCDEEGEWHSHWIAAKPNPSAAYTVIGYAYPAAEATK
jgi:hypothetical protein